MQTKVRFKTLWAAALLAAASLFFPSTSRACTTAPWNAGNIHNLTWWRYTCKLWPGCSGTLTHGPRVALTAGHCIYNNGQTEVIRALRVVNGQWQYYGRSAISYRIAFWGYANGQDPWWDTGYVVTVGGLGSVGPWDLASVVDNTQAYSNGNWKEAMGYSNKLIADKLELSTDTVCSHLKHVFEKMHVSSRTEAVVRYMASKTSPPGPEDSL